MRLSLIPIVFLAWPLAEIAGFVIVGRAIGLWATLGLVILTSLVGAYLLRRQGLSTLRGMSEEGREGRVPGKTIIHGSLIVIAGILLLLPGFITDVIGLTLFVPFIREVIWSMIGRHVVVVGSSSMRGRAYRDNPSRDPGPGPVVELDPNDFERDPNPSSPWRPQDPDRR